MLLVAASRVPPPPPPPTPVPALRPRTKVFPSVESFLLAAVTNPPTTCDFVDGDDGTSRPAWAS